MSEQERQNINSNVAQMADAMRRDDFEASITPGWELIAQGLRDLNRIADALEISARNHTMVSEYIVSKKPIVTDL